MGKAFFLIVDDEPRLLKVQMRTAGRYFLESDRGVDTLTAASGEEAIALVDDKLKAHPDAEWGLLTDHDMPGMNGVALIDALDRMLGDKLLVRIVVTGLLDEERKAIIEAKEAFAESKPMDQSTFQQFLHMFLTRLS